MSSIEFKELERFEKIKEKASKWYKQIAEEAAAAKEKRLQEIENMTTEERDQETISNMTEEFACNLVPLYERKSWVKKEDAIQMYEFDRPSLEIWTNVYQKLLLKGWSHTEAVAWLQSRNVRWLLDGADRMFDDVAQKIVNCADKSQLEQPVEIENWPEFVDKPDLFISHTPEDGIKIYSNEPNMIGDVLVFEVPNDTTKYTNPDYLYDPSVEKIKGNVDNWYTAFGTDRLDLKGFLENFIIKNS